MKSIIYIPWVAAWAMRWPCILKVPDSRPADCTRFVVLISTMHEVVLRVSCPVVWGVGQLIGYSDSVAIVRSLLWSTATGSCPLGYFSSITASSA